MGSCIWVCLYKSFNSTLFNCSNNDFWMGFNCFLHTFCNYVHIEKVGKKYMTRKIIAVLIVVILIGTIVVTLNTVSSDRVEKTQEDPAYTDTGGDGSTDTTDDTTTDDGDTIDNTGTDADDTDGGDTTSGDSDTDDSSSTTDESTDESDSTPAVDKLGTWKQVLTVEYIDGSTNDVLSFLHENKEIKAIEYKIYIDLEDDLPKNPYVRLDYSQVDISITGDGYSQSDYKSLSYDGLVTDKNGFVLLDSFRMPITSYFSETKMPQGDLTISMTLTGHPKYSFEEVSRNSMYTVKPPETIKMTVHHEIDYNTDYHIIDEYEDYRYTKFLETDRAWGQSFELDTSTEIHSVEYVLSKDSRGYVKTQDADSPSTADFKIYLVDTTNPKTPIPGKDNFYQSDPPIRIETVTIKDLTSTPSWREIELDNPIVLESGNYAILLEQVTDGFYHIQTDMSGEYKDDIVSTAIKGIHMMNDGMTSQKFNYDFAFRIWGK